MKCVILVGGYGTRLRPFTFSTPKPLVPFCNIPILEHQIMAAVNVGVTEIILAVGYQAKEIQSAIDKLSTKYGVKIVCSLEKSPLGTAGPLFVIRDRLLEDDEPFFVFNSDVICDFPLGKLLDFHRLSKGAGTIVLTKVDDPSKYGVVVSEKGTGKVEKFHEKPKTFVSDMINAGIYILGNRVVEEFIREGHMMFETDVFPNLASNGLLFSFSLTSFWADIGQPKDYLQGMKLFLNHKMDQLKKGENEGLVTWESCGFKGFVVDESLFIGSCTDNTKEKEKEKGLVIPKLDNNTEIINFINSLKGVRIIPPVMIHMKSLHIIENKSVIGPFVSIDSDCSLGSTVRVRDSSIFSNVSLQDGSYVTNSIVGWNSTINPWATVENSVLGEDVQIKDGVIALGVTVLPHKKVLENSIVDGRIIL